MPLKDELMEQVGLTFRRMWTERNGRVVPEAESLALDNEAVVLGASTVLYADMAGSTDLVQSKAWSFAAEIYKTFLYCAARIITNQDGVVTAYDGDRIMGVFIGDSQSSNAARCALKINDARKSIIMPLLKRQYPNENYELKYIVGIDHSDLKAARTGARGANDLVWIGRAANYAAKLTELDDSYPTWITGEVYDRLMPELKTTDGRGMWEERSWTPMGGMRIYRSNWWWPV